MAPIPFFTASPTQLERMPSLGTLIWSVQTMALICVTVCGPWRGWLQVKQNRAAHKPKAPIGQL